MKPMRSFIALFIASTIILSATSCLEKRGCTDVNSDNYDPSATQDDDTCIPTTEKFIGEYEGYGQNVAWGSDESFENIHVWISDSTVVEPKELLIYIENLDIPTNTLDAKVIDKFEFEVPLQTISGANTFQYIGRASISNRVLRMELQRQEYVEVDDTTYVNNYVFYALKVIED